MVYDADTLVLYHDISPVNKEHYYKMLEDRADEIILEAQHPLKAFFRKLWKKSVDFFT